MDTGTSALQAGLAAAYNRDNASGSGSTTFTKAMLDLKHGSLILVEDQMTSEDIFCLTSFFDTKPAWRYLETLYFGGNQAITNSSTNKVRDRAKQTASEFLENKPKFIKALVRFIGQSTGLISLVIESQHWSESLVCAFVAALASSKSQLRWLNLKNFHLGDNLFDKITQKLVCCPLQFLGLEACRLTDDSAKSVVAIVKAHEAKLDSQYWNASLRTSTCTCKNCQQTDRVLLGSGGPQHMETMLDHLDTSTGLSAISVARNSFTDCTVQLIAATLSGNYWIKGINMGGNKISAIGIFAFFRELSSNEFLTAAIFYGNPGYEEAMSRVHSFKSKIGLKTCAAMDSADFGNSLTAPVRSKELSRLLDESPRVQISEQVLLKIDAVPERAANLLRKWVVAELEQMSAVTGLSALISKSANTSFLNKNAGSVVTESLNTDSPNLSHFDQHSERKVSLSRGVALGHSFGEHLADYETVIGGTDDGTFDGIGTVRQSDLSFGDIPTSFGPPVTLPSTTFQLDRPPSRMSIRPRLLDSFLSEDIPTTHSPTSHLLSTSDLGSTYERRASSNANAWLSGDVVAVAEASARSLQRDSKPKPRRAILAPAAYPKATRNPGTVPRTRTATDRATYHQEAGKPRAAMNRTTSWSRPTSASSTNGLARRATSLSKQLDCHLSQYQPRGPLKTAGAAANVSMWAAKASVFSAAAPKKKKKSQNNKSSNNNAATSAAIDAVITSSGSSTRMRLRRRKVFPARATADGDSAGRGDIVYPDSMYADFFSQDSSEGPAVLSKTLTSFSQTMEAVSDNLRVACEALSRFQGNNSLALTGRFGGDHNGHGSLDNSRITDLSVDRTVGIASIQKNSLHLPNRNEEDATIASSSPSPAPTTTTASDSGSRADPLFVVNQQQGDDVRITELIRKGLREKLRSILEEPTIPV